ncbi:TPA: MFS transporter [Proteus mirabilis]
MDRVTKNIDIKRWVNRVCTSDKKQISKNNCFYKSLCNELVANKKVIMAIGGVYITQTFISMIIMQSVPTLLRNEGFSLSLIGLTSLFMLPWTLKFLWSPFIERLRLPFRKKIRRSRILILTGQLLIALLIFLVILINPSENISKLNNLWVFGMFFLCAFLTSTIDIACDGMAVEQIATSNRGWGNIAQVGGGEIGALLGTSGFLLIVSYINLNVAFILSALVILLLTLPMLLFRESNRVSISETYHIPKLSYAFNRKEVKIGILLVILLEGGNRITDMITGPMLVDMNITLSKIALLMGSFTFFASLFGTLIGGILIKIFGVWKSIFITYGSQGLIFALISITIGIKDIPHEVIFLLMVFKYILFSAGLVAFYTGLMGLSSLKQAGIDFTIFQCTNALIAIFATLLGTWIAEYWSYSFVFAVSSFYTFIAVFIAIRLIKKHLKFIFSSNNFEQYS